MHSARIVNMLSERKVDFTVPEVFEMFFITMKAIMKKQ